MIAFIIRLFLLTVIVLMVYPVVRRMLAGSRPPQPGNTQVRYEPMVSCAVCGLHLPLATAIEHGGRHYCSQDHAGKAH